MFEEALLVFEAQDLNVESAQSQATVLSMMRKKELLPRHDWIILSRVWTELNE